MKYEYKMIQMPVVAAVETQRKKEGAAHWLQDLVNEQAGECWEFHRVDRVGTMMKPGLWARIWGAQASHIEYSVVTFRKPLRELSDETAPDAQAEAFYDPGGMAADTALAEAAEDDAREPAPLPPDEVGLVASPSMPERASDARSQVTQAPSTMRVAAVGGDMGAAGQYPRERDEDAA